jgi:hypothetical protein
MSTKTKGPKLVPLRKMSDNQVFKLSQRSSASYQLLRKDKKTKTATYQSLTSNLTYERSWETVGIIHP